MKKSFLKITAVMSLLLFAGNIAFAQVGENKEAWVFDKTVDNVAFYHKITTCDGKKVVFFKFNNKNHKNVTITWKEVFVTQWKNIQKAGIISEQRQLLLTPGITSGSDCANGKQKNLLGSPKQTSPVYEEEIIQFNYKDIKVAK